MPLLVSELEFRDSGYDLQGTDEIIVIDPVNEKLLKMKVAGFRGASVFYSEDAPTDTPVDQSNYLNYFKGDTYFYQSTDGIALLSWNQDDDLWEKKGYVNGGKIWRSEQLTDAADNSLDSSTDAVWTNEICYAGDLYYNATRGIMYGPYDKDNGFDFSGEDYSKFQFMRSAITREVVADPDTTLNFDDPFEIIGATPLDNTDPLWSPQDGDKIWIQKGDGNGHGGFTYTFSYADYLTQPDALPHQVKVYNVFLDNKEYYRKPLLLSQEGTPSQDNNKYRQGDSVVDSTHAVLWSIYQEAYYVDDTDDGTRDIGDLFVSSTSLKGKDIKYTDIDPVTDDSIYVGGDFIFADNKGTPRIHGPYVYGAASDFESWPLYSVLRSPHYHEHLHTDMVTSGFDPLTLPVDTSSGVMIAEGDYWVKVYTDDLATADESTKRVTYTDGVVVDLENNTLDWGVHTAAHRPSKYWKAEDDQPPAQDDLKFYENDFYLGLDGSVYGPYVENAVSDGAAWPLFTAIAATKTVYVEASDATYIPDTNNNSSDWGGAGIVFGDFIEVSYTGSTTGKTKTWRASEIDTTSGNAITWTRVYQPSVMHYTDELLLPSLNDIEYGEGDYITNGSSWVFGPYVEGASSDEDAWPTARCERGSVRGVVDIVSFTLASRVPLSGRSITIYGDTYLFNLGDSLTYVTPEGKSATTTCLGLDTSDWGSTATTWSDWTYDRAPSTWSSDETGTPLRDDSLYIEGDQIQNADGVLFGPYVEGASDDQTAWPVKLSLRDDIGVIADTGSVDAGKAWKLVINNGILQVEEFTSTP